MNNNVETFLASTGSRVEEYAVADLAACGRSKVTEAALYAVRAGGKRLRPALVFAAASALSPRREFENDPSLLATAAAFEYIHTYSLIHDDLPVMDNDDLRRGKPSCHIAFGVETAVRAGALLIVRAFHAVDGIDSPARIAIIEALTEASGVRGMVGGQALDILGETRAASTDELVRIHSMKTAALIRGAIVAGALAAEADANRIRAMKEIGSATGLAFQIIDDLLDVESTAEEKGKPVGRDGEHGKRTYPSVMGIDASRRRARELIETAEHGLIDLGKQDTILWDLIRFVFHRKR